jgi:hypothetical protein
LIDTNTNKAPNPYYEVFVTEGGRSTSIYKSYPLMNQREGKWDESVIDLGKPKGEIATQQIGYESCIVGKGEARPNLLDFAGRLWNRCSNNNQKRDIQT